MKNYVTLTSKGMCGYVDDSTPCGKALAERVKADLKTFANMQRDPNLTPDTKQAILTDYYSAIKRYVEQEEQCPHCPCASTPCEHRYYKGLTNEPPYEEEEEEPYEEEKDDWCDYCDWEEEDDWEEDWEEEEPTIEDMERYSIFFGESEEIDCDSYSETIEKIGLLLQLGCAIVTVYGYDNQGKHYELDIVEGGEGIYLDLA